jgi:RHS repeat-associated protein
VAARASSAGTVAWYAADKNATVRYLTDAGGTVQATYQYDGFGNLTSNSNASFSDRYHLQGRELDPTTTLTYFRARDVDSTTEKPLQTDPLGFGGDASNVYRYEGNAPTNHRDPSGDYFFIKAGDSEARKYWTDFLGKQFGIQNAYFIDTSNYTQTKAVGYEMLSLSDSDIDAVYNWLAKVETGGGVMWDIAISLVSSDHNLVGYSNGSVSYTKDTNWRRHGSRDGADAPTQKELDNIAWSLKDRGTLGRYLSHDEIVEILKRRRRDQVPYTPQRNDDASPSPIGELNSSPA